MRLACEGYKWYRFYFFYFEESSDAKAFFFEEKFGHVGVFIIGRFIIKV